jgi:hypothetical protein
MTAALGRIKVPPALDGNLAGEPASPEDRWRSISSAPAGADVEVELRPGALVLARKGLDGTWRNSVTRQPLKVRPRRWRARG